MPNPEPLRRCDDRFPWTFTTSNDLQMRCQLLVLEGKVTRKKWVEKEGEKKGVGRRPPH